MRLVRRLLLLLILAAGAVACGGDDEDTDSVNTAVDACNTVCDAIEANGCLDFDYPSLDDCKQDCAGIGRASATCQSAKEADDKCILRQADVCETYMYATGCEDTQEAYYNSCI